LGNRFGLVILTLPVGTRDPVERLVIMKKRMDDIKNSPEAMVAFAILNTMGLAPIEVERFIIDFFAMKTTAVMTNVPGPREPLYLAGSRLNNLMFWVPAAGNLGMGISIMSYAGTVMVGIMTDSSLVGDPATIAENFNAELREMQGWLAPEWHAQSEVGTPAAVEQNADVVSPSMEAPSADVAANEVDAENMAAEEAAAPKEVASTSGEPGHNGKSSAPRRSLKETETAEALGEVPTGNAPE
jgi:hypothetical protein